MPDIPLYEDGIQVGWIDAELAIETVAAGEGFWHNGQMPEEVQKILAAREGARFHPDAESTVTINATDDPRANGGYYVSYAEGDDHSTSVYNPDGSHSDVKANRDWHKVDRQD